MTNCHGQKSRMANVWKLNVCFGEDGPCPEKDFRSTLMWNISLQSKATGTQMNTSYIESRQIIATLHDVGPPKVAFWKGNPLFQKNLGWWILYIIWPDTYRVMIHRSLTKKHISPKWSDTLQGTNISPPKMAFWVDDFPFPVWWDMYPFPGG